MIIGLLVNLSINNNSYANVDNNLSYFSDINKNDEDVPIVI